MRKERKIFVNSLTGLLVLTYSYEGYAVLSGSPLPSLIVFLHIFLSLFGLVAVGFYPAYVFRLFYLKLGEKIDRRIGRKMMVGGKIISFLNFFIDLLFWIIIVPVIFGTLIMFAIVFSGLLPLEAAALILPPIGILFLARVDVEEKMRVTLNPS